MRVRLLRNVAGPWGGGFEGEILHSPSPMPAEVAQQMIRRGYAVELPEAEPAPPAGPEATVNS